MIKIILKNILTIFNFNPNKPKKLKYSDKTDKELLIEDFKTLNQDFQIAKEKLLSKYK